MVFQAVNEEKHDKNLKTLKNLPIFFFIKCKKISYQVYIAVLNCRVKRKVD